jgi:PiT family inorganic phosphate transporter
LVIGAGLALSFYVAWCLGANDAANPTECAVGSGVLSMRRALLLFCVFVAIGALLQGFMVIKTIGKGVVEVPPGIPFRVEGALVVVLSACLWITFCTWKGLPVSTTHSIVGSVLGYGLVRSFLEPASGVVIRWGVVGAIGLSWMASPLAAAGLAFILYRVLIRVIPSLRNADRVISGLVIFSLCFSAYAFGANDVGNATGVFFSIASDLRGVSNSMLLAGLALLGTFGIAVGAFTWGYRVIDTVGFKITRLDPAMGGAAELSNALSVYLFTTIPYLIFKWGMPISTTLASVGSIIGVGVSKNRNTVSRGTVLRIIGAWVMTVPCAAGLCAFNFWLVTSILGA